MKTLDLTLKKAWFDMIVSGVKAEEYREIKEYWVKRLCIRHPNSVITGGDLKDKHLGIQYSIKQFDFVKFSNGYSKSCPQVTFFVSDIVIGEGNPLWGAEPNIPYIIIKLGQEISRKNF